MNSTKAFVLTAVVLGMLSMHQAVNADVTPVVIVLGGDRSTSDPPRPESYQVPPGKTLVIEHLAVERGATPEVTVTVGGFASDLSIKNIGVSAASGADNLGIVTFEQPIHLPAGVIISVEDFMKLSFFGVLAEAGDLYVSAGRPVNATIQAVAKNGADLEMEVKVDPAVPAVVQVQRSTDLETFEDDPTAEVTTVSPARKVVKVETQGDEKLFVKLEARKRSSE